ncbi:hypothetical protein [Streptomyces sp. WM6386]|uniref:hypothetical protein n=1 Tax=Streptomyces sp. WM6386 TaxID=1415558 RepID=UPI000619085B|nr:hypothetical protein [Streptomyces sp. WM6386]KKD05786.1 hypothetical protein TN53_22140 [Streptomyces sp. WM6386]
MSLYQLNKAIRLVTLNLDSAPRELFMRDIDEYARGFDLDQEESAALRAKDIGRLYGMGVQPIILVQFAQLIHDKPLRSLEDLMAFQKQYSAIVAPYGSPSFET